MPSPPFSLGVVTNGDDAGLSDGGERIAAALGNRGVDAVGRPWEDPHVEWDEFDAALFRSCWDYPNDVERFRNLLAVLEAADVAVANPVEAVRWNRHKGYLATLGDAGVRVPATRVFEQGSSVVLENVLRAEGWEAAIVKPAIGTSSAGVWRIDAADAGDAADRFRSLVAEGDVLVQRFEPAIRDGERSIVFFGGEYSHAWNSRPDADDVTTFEGHEADYEPEPLERRQAGEALRAARDALDLDPPDLPYARVDYVTRDGDAVVLELELIEPILGLDRGEGATDRLCEADRRRPRIARTANVVSRESGVSEQERLPAD